MTLIPADLHSKIEDGTDILGGSINEIKPTNVKSFKRKLNVEGFDTMNSYPDGYKFLGKCNLAKPRTRSPLFPNFKFTESNSLSIVLSIGIVFWDV